MWLIVELQSSLAEVSILFPQLALKNLETWYDSVHVAVRQSNGKKIVCMGISYIFFPIK